MSGAPDQPYDLISAELRALACTEGDDLWRNRNRLMGLLLDHQPELRREIRSVVAGVEQGVAAALAQTERSLAAIAIDRQSSLMETEVGLRPEVARNVTWTIAHALDLGPLPSVYRIERPAPEGGAAPPPLRSAAAPPTWPAPTQPVLSQQSAISYGAPRRRFPWAAVAILGTAAVIAAAILLIPLLRGGGTLSLNPPPQGYAMEMADYGVPPQLVLREAALVGTRTPLSVPGGRRITTAELSAMLARGTDVELVDVLGNQHDRTIADAHYVPQAGLGGTLQDQAQASVQAVLQRLTDRDRARPIIFFCLGESCWESYNAVLRASALGYTNLFWYRGGLNAWSQAGLAMGPLPAMEQ